MMKKKAASRIRLPVLRVFDIQIAHLEVKISIEISSVGYMIEVSSHRR